MKLHRFVNDYFHNGAIKYHAGSAYEPNEETRVAVAAGHAETIDDNASKVCDHFQKQTKLAVAAAKAAPKEAAKPEGDGDEEEAEGKGKKADGKKAEK